MKTLFITATGTATGKTYVTAALTAALVSQGKTVRVLKPVISGFEPDKIEETDTALLIRASGGEPTQDAIQACSPWRFKEPLSPDMAAKREGREIDFAGLVDFCKDTEAGPEDVLLCEGIGGAMVPLDDSHTVLDWMAAFGAPALVVAGSYLGTLSHTLTTLAAMRERGVNIAGVVISQSEESPVPVEETVATLERFLPAINISAIGRGEGAEALSEMIGL
ncbi:MAG: dethiobiotin synthase [Proteobacteria bacterium]|nr:dethiobiotin synthase [Pseudomonadota bacterium]MDA1023377.1 dethiobiotin synthase [Pseudomonadota bacterium]